MSIVWPWPQAVSAYLALGQHIEVGDHVCPGCGQRLVGWGGYWRWVRGPGTEHVWIRRGRCTSCRRSHALLPDFLLEHRLDEVEVIGRSLALRVTGLSMRNVAEQLAVPMTTAREWHRRFQIRAPTLAAMFVAFAVHLDPAPVFLATNGAAAALEALGAAWQRARTRFGDLVPVVWRFWSMISGGQALGTNRSPPATELLRAGWMAPSP